MTQRRGGCLCLILLVVDKTLVKERNSTLAVAAGLAVSGVLVAVMGWLSLAGLAFLGVWWALRNPRRWVAPWWAYAMQAVLLIVFLLDLAFGLSRKGMALCFIAQVFLSTLLAKSSRCAKVNQEVVAEQPALPS